MPTLPRIPLGKGHKVGHMQDSPSVTLFTKTQNLTFQKAVMSYVMAHRLSLVIFILMLSYVINNINLTKIARA